MFPQVGCRTFLTQGASFTLLYRVLLSIKYLLKSADVALEPFVQPTGPRLNMEDIFPFTLNIT
jgi:hypothetical protein